jgi:two-component system response regulator
MSIDTIDQNFDQLLSFIRHELRTPINAIIGYAEMIQEDLEDEGSPLAEDCNAVADGGRQLLGLVNQLSLADDTLETTAIAVKDCFTAVSLSMTPPIQAVITGVDTLLNNGLEETFTPDVEKIRTAAIALAHLTHHFDDLCTDFKGTLRAESTASTASTDTLAIAELAAPGQTNGETGVTGHLLVVDDNQTNLDLLERQLSRNGHQVTTCLTAKSALAQLEQNSFDIILLDLIMPETNGYEFLQFLKSHPKFQFIPVIMISALDDFQNIVQCIKVGAEDYLPKPFDPILLKARIDSSLERKRLRDKELLYTQQVETLSALLQQELDKGRQMQKNFLPPKLLSKPGWEFDAFFSPAKQLAGDFYDLFDLPEQTVGIVIADVCDKGVGAALFMGLFRSLIRIFSGQTLLDGLSVQARPNLIMEEDYDAQISHHRILEAIALANNYVAINHGDTGMFATIFFGVINLNTGKMSYVSGGHEPVFIVDVDHRIKHTLNSTGPAVGMLADLPFKIQEITLESGDCLLGYTDGIPEAKSITGEFFGAPRLQGVLSQPQTTAHAVVQSLTQAVTDHIGAAEQFDDITVVAVRRCGP